jgi:TPR repeat protein
MLKFCITSQSVNRDIPTAIQYFNQSAEHGSANGQFAVAWMEENGIGPTANLGRAVRFSERCSELLPARSVCLGWCCQTGTGIPVDLRVAADYLKKAGDTNGADGINSFGCCLEHGQGFDVDIEFAVRHYQRAAFLSQPDGMENFGRCLEYGKGTEQDLHRAGKSDRLSAELKNPAAQNSFGICF